METWLTVAIALIAAVGGLGGLASLFVALAGRRAQVAQADKLMAETEKLGVDMHLSLIQSWKLFVDEMERELAQAKAELEIAQERIRNSDATVDQLRAESAAAIAANSALTARLAECKGQDLTNGKS